MAILRDHVAVVTGASSGIGRAIALALAAEGAALCLVGRSLETLEEVAEAARPAARRVRSHRADLTVDGDVRNLVADIERDWRAVDVLVHGAGVIASGELAVAPVEVFDWQYRTNVRAPYALTQALLPLIKSRRGQIVFINSTAGLGAKATLSQYAATKQALRAIADSLREEVNSVGVRVLSVYPGRTATPMQASVHASEGRSFVPERLMQPEDVAAVVVNALRLPRSAEVTDINMRPMIKAS